MQVTPHARGSASATRAAGSSSVSTALKHVSEVVLKRTFPIESQNLCELFITHASVDCRTPLACYYFYCLSGLIRTTDVVSLNVLIAEFHHTRVDIRNNVHIPSDLDYCTTAQTCVSNHVPNFWVTDFVSTMRITNTKCTSSKVPHPNIKIRRLRNAFCSFLGDPHYSTRILTICIFSIVLYG